MELTTITRRVGEICGIDAAAIEPDPRFVRRRAGWQGREGARTALCAPEQEAAAATPRAFARDARPLRPAPRRRRILPARELSEAKAPIDRDANTRRCAASTGSMPGSRAHATAGLVAVDSADATARSRCRRSCAASSLAPRRTRPATCRSAIAGRRGRRRACSARRPRPRPDSRGRALDALKPLLDDRGVLKIGHDLKFAWQIFGAARHRDRRLSTTPC